MRRRPILVLLFFTLLAFILRVYRLDFVSLRGDEAFTVLFVQQPFAQMWEGIRTVEPNPPLMYLLLRAWIFIAGASEFATRYFSVFFGVLCVPLIYRVGREMRAAFSGEEGQGLQVGLIAAFLLMINPYQIWHSQDVRNYTLWPALSLAGMIFFFRWLAANWASYNHRRRALALYFIFTFASLFTHYYDAFIVLAQNIFVLAIFWRRWRALGEWFIAQVMLGVSFLAWALVFSNRAAAYGEGSGIQGLGILEIAQRTFSSFVLGETLPMWARNFAWIPFALAALAIWYFLIAPRLPRLAAWLLLYAALPTLAVYTLSLFRQLFLERYLNGIAPAYYLTFALGLAYISKFQIPDFSFQMPNRKPILFAFCFLLFASCSGFALGEYYFNPAFAKAPNWQALAQYIRANRRAGDVILQNFPEMSSFYYFDNAISVQVLPTDFMPDAKTDGALAALAKQYSRIWFLPAAPDYWDPDHFVEHWLDSQTDLQDETQLSTFRLRLYDTAQLFLPARTPTLIRAEDFATLIGYRTARQAGRTRIVLYWQPAVPTTKNYTVFVHAIRADGSVLAQQDNQPVNGTRPTNGWRAGEVIVDQYLVGADEPTMQIEVGMYDAATNARVPLFDANEARLEQDRFLIEIKR